VLDRFQQHTSPRSLAMHTCEVYAAGRPRNAMAWAEVLLQRMADEASWSLASMHDSCDVSTNAFMRSR
jgi:hypothetical protein